jgi:hypothetical protein
MQPNQTAASAVYESSIPSQAWCPGSGAAKEPKLAGVARTISPDVRSGPPGLRSLGGNLASPSWLRSVSYAARLVRATPPNQPNHCGNNTASRARIRPDCFASVRRPRASSSVVPRLGGGKRAQTRRSCPHHLTGRSLRPSRPSLTRRKPRFAFVAPLGFLRRSTGTGNSSEPTESLWKQYRVAGEDTPRLLRERSPTPDPPHPLFLLVTTAR